MRNGGFRRLLHYVVRDVWRKLVALTLAVLCWGWLRYQISQEEVCRCKVIVKYDKSRYFVRESDREYDVRLTKIVADARGGFWDRLSGGGRTAADGSVLEVTLDERKMGGLSRGRATFTMHDLPGTDILVKMKPEKFSVEYDTLVEKTVPVRLPAPKPLGGYELRFISAEPSNVTLRGPSHYLKDILEVMPEIPEGWLDPAPGEEGKAGISASLLEMNSPKSYEMKVKNNYQADNISSSVKKVTITVEKKDVGMRISWEGYRNLEVLFKPEGMECDVDGDGKVFIQLKGDSAAMRAFEEKKKTQLFVYVNLKGIETAGEVDVPVQIAGIPRGIESEYIQPSSVKLTLRRNAGAAPPQEPVPQP